ncbi:hypothetical protein [Rhizobium leguminosarum]
MVKAAFATTVNAGEIAVAAAAAPTERIALRRVIEKSYLSCPDPRSPFEKFRRPSVRLMKE